MAGQVVIERRVAIRSNGSKLSWVLVPDEIEGREFVKLAKSDGGFSRFISGTTKGCTNMDWLAELKRLRTEASINLAVPCDQTLFDREPSHSELRANKKQATLLQQVGDLPKLVKVKVPDIDINGETVKGLDLTCVTCLDIKTPVQVELTSDAMHYIKMAMLSKGCRDLKRARSSEATNVFWRARRHRFVAKRSTSAGDQYKSFKPADNDDVAMEECRQLAQRWANGEDVDDGDCEGNDDGEDMHG